MTHGQGQRPAAGSGALAVESLEVIPGPVTDGKQLLMLLDRSRQCLCTYQIDVPTGQISLRCVRNVAGDLLLDDFNGTDPTPEKIRAMFQDR